MSPSQLTKGVDTITNYVKKLPQTPGVYRMCNHEGKILYIGKARNLKKRVTAYTKPDRLPYRLQRMISQTDHMYFEYCHSETEALLLEAQMIKTLNPRYNILLTDDKSYPFLYVTTQDDIPRVMKYRRKAPKNKSNKSQKSKEKGCFFGPYVSGHALNQALHVIHRVFKLRSCPDTIFMHRKRPCQEYQIKRCSAPCVGRISTENYQSSVKQAIDFFSGRHHDLQEELIKDMQLYSDSLNFEKAAEIRDQIQALNKLQYKKGFFVADLIDADLIAIVKQQDMIGIHFMMVRAHQYLGGRTLFPRNNSESLASILSNSIAQYYSYHPAPPIIMTNIISQQANLIETALSENWQQKIKLITPQRGDKKKMMDNVVYNASEAITVRLNEQRNQKQMMTDMQNLLGFDNPLTRIEIYDNSHISGKQARGVMVVVTENGFDKKSYRQFKFDDHHDKNITQDDFAMMETMLDRRLKRLINEKIDKNDEQYPSLLLIDGGKGQLSKVNNIVKKYHLQDSIYIAAIAKGVDRNAGKETIFIPKKSPITLSPQDPTAHFIQNIRDESHRFAITTHRKAREKNNYTSPLDTIEGIGTKRKKALIAYFGSAKDVMAATIDELQNVPGISKDRAEKLYQYFRY